MIHSVFKLILSYWMSMHFGNAILFSLSVCSPVNIQNYQGESYSILIWDLPFPRFILLRPGYITVICEFWLLSCLEIALINFWLTLYGMILEISPPVVKIVIIKADCLLQKSTSQHVIKNILYQIKQSK